MTDRCALPLHSPTSRRTELLHFTYSLSSSNVSQLACARINSPEGQDYLKAMAAAANYAWVNRCAELLEARSRSLSSLIFLRCRQSMTFLVRQAFAKIFHSTPDDLDMHLIYDVSHNIAKIEEHVSVQHPLLLLLHLLFYTCWYFDSA